MAVRTVNNSRHTDTDLYLFLDQALFLLRLWVGNCKNLSRATPRASDRVQRLLIVHKAVVTAVTSHFSYGH